MKKLIIALIIMVANFTIFGQSGNLVAPTCTVPAGWTSCSTSCWFSDCCVVWNPNVSEGGCGCWFGVALCRTGAVGQSLQIENTTSRDATIKFSFERFNEFINFLNSRGIVTNTITAALNQFKTNYVSPVGKVSVATDEYIVFMNNYTSFINSLTNEQKAIVGDFLAQNQKAANPG